MKTKMKEEKKLTEMMKRDQEINNKYQARKRQQKIDRGLKRYKGIQTLKENLKDKFGISL